MELDLQEGERLLGANNSGYNPARTERCGARGSRPPPTKTMALWAKQQQIRTR